MRAGSSVTVSSGSSSVMDFSLVRSDCGMVGPMRVAVVAGPDPGHSFPAIALCRRFQAAGDEPTLLTGVEVLEFARAAGVNAIELDGLKPAPFDDDTDAGAKIHQRAARMAVLNAPRLAELAPDLIVSDIITAGGALAAEIVSVPWIELCPHPLYLPSKGLPPVGSGLHPEWDCVAGF